MFFKGSYVKCLHSGYTYRVVDYTEQSNFRGLDQTGKVLGTNKLTLYGYNNGRVEIFQINDVKYKNYRIMKISEEIFKELLELDMEPTLGGFAASHIGQIQERLNMYSHVYYTSSGSITWR